RLIRCTTYSVTGTAAGPKARSGFDHMSLEIAVGITLIASHLWAGNLVRKIYLLCSSGFPRLISGIRVGGGDLLTKPLRRCFIRHQRCVWLNFYSWKKTVGNSNK